MNGSAKQCAFSFARGSQGGDENMAPAKAASDPDREGVWHAGRAKTAEAGA
jgi:hypothetical protein